jgi:hypothetical protein
VPQIKPVAMSMGLVPISRAFQASTTLLIRRVMFNVALMDVIWQSAVGPFPRATTLMETEAARASRFLLA